MESGMGKCHTACTVLVTPAIFLSPGSELPRGLWVALNRLRTGDGRFGACLYRWGILDAPKCDCGAVEQSANHIIFDCNSLLPPNCLEDLRFPNINNTKWLEDLMDFVWTAALRHEEEECQPLSAQYLQRHDETFGLFFVLLLTVKQILAVR